MAGALKTAALYGIEEQKRCWLVSLTRYTKRWVKSFAFSMYGGREPALLVAQAWRDRIAREHPPILRRDKATTVYRNNKSGIPGVVCLYRKDGSIERWLAKTHLVQEGRILQKSFSVSRYGERAKELAISERQKQLEQMEGRIHKHPATDTSNRLATEPQLFTARPVLQRVQVIHRNNRSGVAGVSCVRSRDGQPSAWVAKTQLAPGKTLWSQFSIRQFGNEKAKGLAIQERARQLAQRRTQSGNP
jgi:hypothetical protein